MSEVVTALGAMSGTSLDGVDAAVLRTDGERIEGFGPAGYRPYSSEERAILRSALGRWNGPEVDAATRVVEDVHAEILSGFAEVDLIGFHGQTLAHEPRGRGTLQVGDGTRLAQVLHRPVVWDFRSEDVRKGGEGAPLAPFYHFALTRWIGASEPLAVLNLGGVGNLTWVDPRRERPEEDGALIAFDTGPANALMDDLMLRRRGVARDEGGGLADAGRVDESIVNAFLALPFFARQPPKSLDRDQFAALGRAVENLPDADAVATLTACSARAVGQGLLHCPTAPTRLLVTGGGRHNTTLMRWIAKEARCAVEPVEAHGLDGDMLEAQAFAFLAVRVLRGLPTSAPGTTGVGAPLVGGIVSQPEMSTRSAGSGRAL
ncbi:anhydro-N-acetylmuramic acid kinase [Rubellimicrobium rubrum]|uniref:Anhydro-N-acetylmuramic acid kinase n=1 Tax=Rubellimicrobium rubrum TaxID=2585369 RepID=A0A5C4MZU7_9RHOB|nr:anhydro-N-acetylmuramic acid kinase [Rubellimicrobium rubrum]TNC50460.1 anhydro-N-acetylmuramic acid kinase [Rubellimicrobium rubrum]